MGKVDGSRCLGGRFVWGWRCSCYARWIRRRFLYDIGRKCHCKSFIRITFLQHNMVLICIYIIQNAYIRDIPGHSISKWGRWRSWGWSLRNIRLFRRDCIIVGSTPSSNCYCKRTPEMCKAWQRKVMIIKHTDEYPFNILNCRFIYMSLFSNF